MIQRSLFREHTLREILDDPPSQPTPTSEAAAQSVKGPVSGRQRNAVLNVLRTKGEHGATDEEIQTELGLNPSAERPRRIELQELGLVRDSGTTRQTRSGRSAVVWVAARSQ